jgi:hypothetical protein
MTRLTHRVVSPLEAVSWQRSLACAALSLVAFAASAVPSAAQTAGAVDPTAAKVQPILAANCYSCHTTKMKGGLRLDTLAAILKGGESGPAVVPGSPDESLLVKAVRYKDSDLQMPPKGKLPDADIAAIEAWVKASAPELPMATTTVSAELTPRMASAQEQYFETKVRPLLVSKCYACHTAGAAGGLRLDSREGVMKGGRDGAVIDLAHPENSLLLTAIHYGKPGLQMPPKGPLEDAQVAVLEQWIKDGAVWPVNSGVSVEAVVTDKDRAWWSYQKPMRPEVPKVADKWAYNDIDRFVLAKLEAGHMTPVADADKRTMIRRATYDLTGLPPTPSEINAYLADKSPDAYPKLVDRLLASKAYAERWGRVWMDVVRYSDTTGEGADYPIPEMYKYRDYIVQSFADDVPYDRFIREQIAGDLLPAKTEPEHWRNIIATGYLANANRYEDYVSDAVDNIGYAYLGTSVACARCHDHKFDPIPTSDYYAMYGILASTKYAKSGEEDTRYETDMVYRDPNVVKSREYIDFQAQLKPIADTIHAAHQLPYFDDILPALEARRMALFANAPHFEAAYAVQESTPHDENIQPLGDKKNRGDIVPRHFLQLAGNWQLPPNLKTSGRLELANWIASPQNPLTARVMVNRLWQEHFGRGIVATPNDFGKRGDPPSDQPLLDYLATEFVAKGWSIKAMQREMVLSHVYQLSSLDSEADEKADPDNIALWRHSPARMDAEEIRDTMLATSGMLDATPAGAQPFPKETKWNYSGHVPFHAVYETNRRTLYVMTQRSRRHPYLGLFDGPDSTTSVGTRDSSITPLQSLYFLNGDFPKQCSEKLADKLEADHVSTKDEINRAFLLIYGRPAEKDEIAHAEGFINAVSDLLKQHGTPLPEVAPSPLKNVALTTGGSSASGTTPLSDADAHHQALGKFIQVLYASNEFMFLD